MGNDSDYGAWVVARLLAGVPVATLDLGGLVGSWAGLANQVARANGQERKAAFYEAIKGRPDARNLETAVFSVDPTAPCPGSQADDDALPDTAPVPGLPEPLAEVDPSAGRWLTNFVTFAGQAAPMTPRSFHEALSLFALSTAVARRVCLRVSTTAIFPNLYIMLVAPSTLFHKTTGLNLGQDVMKLAGLERMMLAPLQTPESLLGELSARRPPTFEQWGGGEQEAWRAERAFAAQRGWAMEEGSRLLDSFNRDYSAGLLPLVLALFDCPEREVYQTVGRGRQVVSHAYLNILGATTPASIRVHLANSQHWANGLWARFILVTPDGDMPWAFWPQPMEIPEGLTHHLQHLALERLSVPDVDKDPKSGEVTVRAVRPLTVKLAEGVWQAWGKYAKTLSYDMLRSGEVDERLFACYGRLPTTAIKVAMLLACADWVEEDAHAPTIGLAHWTRALVITEGWRASLHRLVAVTQKKVEEQAETKIIGIITKAGTKGLTPREVQQQTGLERALIDASLVRLVADGLMTRTEELAKNGRQVARYRIA